VDAVLAELSRHGQACLTGTGSGCFASFGTEAQARAAAAALPPGWRSEVVAGAARSPLLDALERWR
jgi:4-diphosphocytidyl-2-C-methyl-D-erythritol kinase